MIVRVDNVATVETAVAHGLNPGDLVEIAAVEGVSAGRWNIVGPVLTVSDPVTFTLASPGEDGFGIGGVIISLKAPSSGDVPGPYILDISGGYAITSVNTTTTMDVTNGRGVSILTVANTGSFPNEEGWLVIGFGTQYEAGPFKMLAVLNTTSLIIDKTYLFPQTIPSGTSITLLSQKGPWKPTHPEQIGAFYITDSSAGRSAAAAFIDDATAAGVDVQKYIMYPGDRGIGGEGNPIAGPALSDKIMVWAGSDVDTEWADAHNG